MRQQFRSKSFLSIGFWIVLGAGATMLTGWPAGSEPAHSVQGQSFGGASASGLMTAGLLAGGSSRSGTVKLGSGQQGFTGQRGLISYVQTSDTKDTSIILIDSVQQVISVYHILRDDGRIQLKSVRKIAWDSSLTDYNTSQPLPDEIHKGLQRQ
ncbi:MAG: hypothetical protein ABGX16_19240 [Pirellulales bacterium]